MSSINPRISRGSGQALNALDDDRSRLTLSIELGSQLAYAYEVISKVSANRNRLIQDGILEGVTNLFKKLEPIDLELDEIVSVSIGLISILLDPSNLSERSRTDMVIVASTLASRTPKGGKLRSKVAEKLTNARRVERAPAVLLSLDRAIQVLSS